jgi:hypothetical protein
MKAYHAAARKRRGATTRCENGRMVAPPAASRPVGFHERCRLVEAQRRKAWGRAPDRPDVKRDAARGQSDVERQTGKCQNVRGQT